MVPGAPMESEVPGLLCAAPCVLGRVAVDVGGVKRVTERVMERARPRVARQSEGRFNHINPLITLRLR